MILAFVSFYANLADGVNSWWRGEAMPRPASDDRIIIRFDLADDLDLEEMSEGFVALARLYRKTITEHGLSEEEAPTKLLVTRLESGSLETELAAYWMMARNAIQAMDATIIFSDFASRMSGAIRYFVDGGARPARLDKDDVSDLETFLKPLAGRKGARLSVKTATLS